MGKEFFNRPPFFQRAMPLAAEVCRAQTRQQLLRQVLTLVCEASRAMQCLAFQAKAWQIASLFGPSGWHLVIRCFFSESLFSNMSMTA
jgi:hypothetical protein